MPNGGGEGAPQEAPAQSGDDGDSKSANTETLTLGPTGGESKEDDRTDGDKDGDSSGDNNQEKQASKEGLKATEVADCRPGEQPDIFTNKCESTVLADNPTNKGPTTAATSCPIGPTPTSYMMPDELTLINAIWRSGSYDYEIDALQPDKRQALVYLVADEDRSDNDDFSTFGQQSPGASTLDPCPSKGDEQGSETRERLPDGGSKTTRANQDGTSVVTILNLKGVRDPEGKLVPDAVEQDTKYNAQNKPTKTDSYDSSQNLVGTTAYDPKSGNPTHTTIFAANGDLKGTAAYSYNAQNRLTQVFHLDAQNNLLDRTVNTYTPNNLPRTSTTYDSNNQPTSKIVYAGGYTPLSETYYEDGKPVSVTRYDESGKMIGTFGPDGKPLGSSPATSPATTPNAQ